MRIVFEEIKPELTEANTLVSSYKDAMRPSFTRQHFQSIADIFKNANPDRVTHESVVYLAGEMAAFFKQDNPGFDKARFMKAAGL